MDPNAIPPADPPAMGTVGNTNLNNAPDAKANMPDSQDASGTLVGMAPVKPTLSENPTKSADEELAAAASLSQGVAPAPMPETNQTSTTPDLTPPPASMPAPPSPAMSTPESMPTTPDLTPPPANPTPAASPTAAMTTASGGKSSFGLFLGLGVAIVVFIWVGVGFLYYSNMTLEQEINATVSAQASGN